MKRQAPTNPRIARAKTSAPPKKVGAAKATRHPTRKPPTRKPMARNGSAHAAEPPQRDAARPRSVPPTAPEARDHVLGVLATFDTVMVVSADGDELRARPMAVKERGADGSLTFFTAAETAKVGEVQRDHRGAVIAQGKMSWVALDGTLSIHRDPDRVRFLWAAADKVYFPNGPDDPTIRLMVFRPKVGEVWDLRGPKGLRFLFEAARALIKGTRPVPDSESHDRVTLAAE